MQSLIDAWQDIWGVGCMVWGVGYGGMEYRIWGVGCDYRMQGMGCRV